MPEFGGDWRRSVGKEGKNVIFPKAPLIFPTFLWVVVHFITVKSCILDLINSFREKIGRDLETYSTF